MEARQKERAAHGMPGPFKFLNERGVSLKITTPAIF
jgi:hypothetical protein